MQPHGLQSLGGGGFTRGQRTAQTDSNAAFPFHLRNLEIWNDHPFLAEAVRSELFEPPRPKKYPNYCRCNGVELIVAYWIFQKISNYTKFCQSGLKQFKTRPFPWNIHYILCGAGITLD